MSKTQRAGKVDDTIGKRDSDVGFVTRLKRQQFHVGAPDAPSRESKADLTDSSNGPRDFLWVEGPAAPVHRKPVAAPTNCKSTNALSMEGLLPRISRVHQGTFNSDHPLTIVIFPEAVKELRERGGKPP